MCGCADDSFTFCTNEWKWLCDTADKCQAAVILVQGSYAALTNRNLCV